MQTRELIASCREGFSKLKPKNVIFERECIFALQALIGNDYIEDIVKKNPDSVRKAIFNIASVDISLNPIKKEAYLIPRVVGKHPNKKPMICLDISYRGLVNLAISSGGVIVAQADIVYSDDEFKWKGKFKEPEHSFNPFSRKRGVIVGAYVTAKIHDGTFVSDFMTIDEIYAIRDKSEMYKKFKNGPWVDFETEMIKKTVIKRASKMWPKMSDHFHRAVDYTDKNEGINFEEEKRDVEAQFMKKYELIEEIKNRLNILAAKKQFKDMSEKMNFMFEVLGVKKISTLSGWEIVSLEKKLDELDEMIKGVK